MMMHPYGLSSNISNLVHPEAIISYIDPGNPSAYPNSGTIIKDLTNNVSGSMINSPTFNSSGGGSLYFDGASSYADFGTKVSTQSLTLPITISSWIKPDNITMSEQVGIITLDNDIGNVSYYGLNFALAGGVTSTNTYFMSMNTGDGLGASSLNRKTIQSNTRVVSSYIWQNVTVVYVSFTEAYIYLNGNLVPSTFGGTGTTLVWTNGVGKYTLGHKGGGSPGSFYGLIGQSIVYNVALTSTEVMQNFETFRKRYGV